MYGAVPCAEDISTSSNGYMNVTKDFDSCVLLSLYHHAYVEIAKHGRDQTIRWLITRYGVPPASYLWSALVAAGLEKETRVVRVIAELAGGCLREYARTIHLDALFWQGPKVIVARALVSGNLTMVQIFYDLCPYLMTQNIKFYEQMVIRSKDLAIVSWWNKHIRSSVL